MSGIVITYPDPLPGIIETLNGTEIVYVDCKRQYSPPVVEIGLPEGVIVTLKYDTYEMIREAAGLPDDVCKPDGE